MGMRDLFHDGVQWTVWDVRPTSGSRVSFGTAPGYEDGWLCFESPRGKRRSAPIPEGWEEWPDERLADALASAGPVPVRTRSTFVRPDSTGEG